MRSIIVAVVAAVAIIGTAQAQTDLDDLSGKRIAPEIGTTGYSIATEERRHAAYPRQHWRSALRPMDVQRPRNHPAPMRP